MSISMRMSLKFVLGSVRSSLGSRLKSSRFKLFWKTLRHVKVFPFE